MLQACAVQYRAMLTQQQQRIGRGELHPVYTARVDLGQPDCSRRK